MFLFFLFSFFLWWEFILPHHQLRLCFCAFLSVADMETMMELPRVSPTKKQTNPPAWSPLQEGWGGGHDFGWFLENTTGLKRRERGCFSCVIMHTNLFSLWVFELNSYPLPYKTYQTCTHTLPLNTKYPLRSPLVSTAQKEATAQLYRKKGTFFRFLNTTSQLNGPSGLTLWFNYKSNCSIKKMWEFFLLFCKAGIWKMEPEGTDWQKPLCMRKICFFFGHFPIFYNFPLVKKTNKKKNNVLKKEQKKCEVWMTRKQKQRLCFSSALPQFFFHHSRSLVLIAGVHIFHLFL